jgi:gamma-glutamylcyclotransferase (GGCT)/AIG2-like uncharacterized protein YtfP
MMKNENLKKVYLFAYGSMKAGFKNHWRVENDSFIGNAKTVERYNMYPAVSYNYPYAVEHENKWQLDGELYELTSTDIEYIDTFEGAPDYYYRKEIEVVCNNKIYETNIYFRNSTNPTGMDTDVAIDEWLKEFEKVGKKNDEYLEALRLALLAKERKLLIKAKMPKDINPFNVEK